VGEVVLIADDEEDIIRFVEINLRLEGLEVITAQDGEEALQKAFTQRPSLILLDAMMPRMDGYEVCAKLRADERTFQTPIIMLTAKSLEADRALARDVGADDCIIKPFDPTELVDRVKSRLAGGTGAAGTAPWSGGGWGPGGGAGSQEWPGGGLGTGGADPSPGWGGDPWPGGMGEPGAGSGDPWPGAGAPAGSAWPDRRAGVPGTGGSGDPWLDEDERDPWSSGGHWPTR
jgi:CheY-like chemotaxis protein